MTKPNTKERAKIEFILKVQNHPKV